MADAQDVLRTLVSKEVEVRNVNDEWFIMRILPYRTTENVIDGVVLTFVETTMIKTLQATQERILRGIMNSRTTIFTLTSDLQYEWVSGDLFGHRAEDVIKRTDAEILPRAAAGQLTDLKTRALRDIHSMRERLDLELESGTLTCDVYVEPILGEDGDVRVVIGAITRL